jgi:hypothetical protein
MTLGKHFDSFFDEVGQVLLIVILVVIVASTIGLSLVSRSITSLRSSTEEAQSQKALSAAEAGIERTVQGNLPAAVNTVLGNNSKYFTIVSSSLSFSFQVNGGNFISKDEGADVWFVNHNSSGDPDYSTAVAFGNYLHLYWGSPTEICGTSNPPAAIQAIVVTKNKSTGEIKSYRYAYDSCSRGNNFTPSDAGNFADTEHGITGIAYGNRTRETGTNIDLAKNISDIVLVRVIPIYKDTIIGVYACSRAKTNCTSLPLQGYQIDSTGISGDATRKIRVFKGWPQAYLPYLSYGLFVAN